MPVLPLTPEELIAFNNLPALPQRDAEAYPLGTALNELYFAVVSASNPQITGQNTAGLPAGSVCYLSAANTWTIAQSDGTLPQGTSLGVYDGIPGSIALAGSTIAALQCTTAGGAPAINDRLYLARSSDDAGTGAGKVTPVPPTPPPGGSVLLQVIGVCVDASAYAGFKTVKAILLPTYPVVLIG